MTEDELNAIYRGDGFGSRIVDVLTEDMTRKWFHIEGDTDDGMVKELSINSGYMSTNYGRVQCYWDAHLGLAIPRSRTKKRLAAGGGGVTCPPTRVSYCTVPGAEAMTGRGMEAGSMRCCCTVAVPPWVMCEGCVRGGWPGGPGGPPGNPPGGPGGGKPPPGGPGGPGGGGCWHAQAASSGPGPGPPGG